jgi:hypothetical protein
MGSGMDSGVLGSEEEDDSTCVRPYRKAIAKPGSGVGSGVGSKQGPTEGPREGSKEGSREGSGVSPEECSGVGAGEGSGGEDDGGCEPVRRVRSLASGGGEVEPLISLTWKSYSTGAPR